MQIIHLTHSLRKIQREKKNKKNLSQKSIIINKQSIKKRMQKFVKYYIRNYSVRKFVFVAA